MLTRFLGISILLLYVCACGGNGGSGNSARLDDIEEQLDQTPTIEPIESAFKTMVPLGYIASVVMALAEGYEIENAAITNSCNSFPCAALATVELNSTVMPIALDGYGDVTVAGLWTNAESAVLSMSFTDMEIGTGIFPVPGITTIPVRRYNGMVTFVYGASDIDINTQPAAVHNLGETEIQQELARLDQEFPQDPELALFMEAWSVQVDDEGTPSVFLDDTFTLNGGGQGVETSIGQVSVLQLAMVDSQFSFDCSLNPVTGMAVLQEIEVSSGPRSTWPKLGQALIQFDSICGGEANILIGSGSFLLQSGNSVNLGFAN